MQFTQLFLPIFRIDLDKKIYLWWLHLNGDVIDELQRTNRQYINLFFYFKSWTINFVLIKNVQERSQEK